MTNQVVQGAIDWNDLAGALAAGLVIHSIEQLQDAETMAVVTIPDNLMSQLQSHKPSAKHGKPLRDTLKEMWDACTAHPDIPARRPNLGGGLGVALLVTAGGTIRLQIHRPAPQIPGENEWDTVIKHFPVPVVAENKRRIVANGTNYLQADLVLVYEPELALEIEQK